MQDVLILHLGACYTRLLCAQRDVTLKWTSDGDAQAHAKARYRAMS